MYSNGTTMRNVFLKQLKMQWEINATFAFSIENY